MKTMNDDRIFRSTRLVAVMVVPFLVLAFIILYFMPHSTGTRFAWEIKPDMTAAFMGAGYLGGSWLFLNAIWGKRWHRVAPGFLPVTAFTVCMLLTTALHWERFDLSHRPFQIWLILYIVTPFLIPFLWYRNRGTDPHTLESGGLVVPLGARWGLGLLGGLLLGFAASAFVVTDFIIDLWPWALTPLTARIMGGWFALLGVGGILIAREYRWSGWRVGLQAIAIWQILVLIGALMNAADFTNGLANWYLAGIVVVLAGMTVLYVTMEMRR